VLFFHLKIGTEDWTIPPANAGTNQIPFDWPSTDPDRKSILGQATMLT